MEPPAASRQRLQDKKMRGNSFLDRQVCRPKQREDLLPRIQEESDERVEPLSVRFQLAGVLAEDRRTETERKAEDGARGLSLPKARDMGQTWEATGLLPTRLREQLTELCVLKWRGCQSTRHRPCADPTVEMTSVQPSFGECPTMLDGPGLVRTVLNQDLNMKQQCGKRCTSNPRSMLRSSRKCFIVARRRMFCSSSRV